jgi:hypothetical protein
VSSQKLHLIKRTREALHAAAIRAHEKKYVYANLMRPGLWLKYYTYFLYVAQTEGLGALTFASENIKERTHRRFIVRTGLKLGLRILVFNTHSKFKTLQKLFFKHIGQIKHTSYCKSKKKRN